MDRLCVGKVEKLAAGEEVLVEFGALKGVRYYASAQFQSKTDVKGG